MKNKLIILFMILFGILSLGGRVWWGSADELIQAETALGKKDYPSAVIHYEKVILWNFPFEGYSEKAVKGIETIQQMAQSEKNQLAERYAQDALAFAMTSIGKSPKSQTNSIKTQIPNPFWSAMVGLSLLTWIGIAFLFIVSCFENNLKIANKKKGVFIFTLLVIALSLWIFSINQL
ncbi:MAG: hypothetical protein V2B13_02605 [Pseudomonadota bacterium]